MDEIIVTETEQKIANLLFEHGYHDDELAKLLYCSRRTIETHIASLLAKTECRDKLKLIVWMRTNRLIASNKSRKLSAEQIHQLRAMKLKGARTVDIAKQFGITPTYVNILAKAQHS